MAPEQESFRLKNGMNSFSNDLYENEMLFVYSRLPIIRTFKGNREKFELSGVRVIEGKII